MKGGGVKEFYLMAGVKKKEEGKNEWNKENSKGTQFLLLF